MRYRVCISVLLLSSIFASAQDTRGNISGTVTDAKSAVPDASEKAEDGEAVKDGVAENGEVKSG